MSIPEHIRRARGRRLIWLCATSLVLLGLIGLRAMSGPGGMDKHPRTGTPVLSQTGLTSTVARIQVRLADGNYALVRAGDSWHMDSALGYPVRLEQVGALLTGLSELSWGAAKTRDPRKHDQIGLADPDNGGNGAELRLFDAAGDQIAAFIVGRRDERLYLRNTGEALSFQADGDLPPLQARHGWMDFQVIAILPSAIEGAVLEPGGGERLHLVRAESGGPRDFVPGPAHADERLVSGLAAATPALALSRFSPLDVKPATQLETAPVARHITLTKDGLEVVTEAYEEAEGFYLTIHAVEAAEVARRAEDINARAHGWAFRVSRFDWADFVVEISDIVERPIVDAPED
ncbi:MAG: DUF4340 domain-containing protein [Hyphomonadaceae bacterium]|nr:DUF4340 domain-containing protein [Hyphomonadaceae bacterium]